jgi:hypothetical protein
VRPWRHGAAARAGPDFVSTRQSSPGFRLDPDSGQVPLGALRLQISSGGYWSGPGDGSCVDVVRQLAAALPDTALIASIERRHLDAFAAESGRWPRRPKLTLIAEDLPVAQWTQDNAKPGRNATGEPVLLAPRYASRGEVGAVLVPGETFLTEGLAAAGLRVVRSPLLFQGGNLMLVEEASGGRTLLAGEAEVWRNTAMGLTREQALEALRVEFDADRCIDLPSPSFHIDYELSIRAMTGQTVAFVNDAAAAARIILGCGIRAMAGGLRKATEALDHLASHRTREAMAILGPALDAASIAPGRFSESFAARFSTSPCDHGPSNLYRVLHAIDVLTALTMAPSQWPADAHTRAYLESYQRQESERRAMRRTIESLGWRIVQIPSMADPWRGINALNGLHGPGQYLMPAYGGLFEPLDAQAESVFGSEFGSDIRVIRVCCAESQRRSGALRCAASHLALPRSFGVR